MIIDYERNKIDVFFLFWREFGNFFIFVELIIIGWVIMLMSKFKLNFL